MKYVNEHGVEEDIEAVVYAHLCHRIRNSGYDSEHGHAISCLEEEVARLKDVVAALVAALARGGQLQPSTVLSIAGNKGRIEGVPDCACRERSTCGH